MMWDVMCFLLGVLLARIFLPEERCKMGVDTEAILCYGVDLGDEDGEYASLLPWMILDADDEPIYDDMEEWLCEQAGIESPWDRTTGEVIREEIDAWTAARKAAYLACPVEEVRYGSDGCGVILAVRGTVEQSGRWRASKTSWLAPSGEQIMAFKRWCADHNIDLPDEPWWLLAPYVSW